MRRFGDKFKFLQRRGKLRFFLGLFSLRYGAAQAAGMLAVESLDESLFYGSGLEIFREHRRPRDGLEEHPMRSGCRNHGNNHERMTKFPEHKATFANRPRFVKKSGSR